MPSLKALKQYTSLPQVDEPQNDLEKEGDTEPWGSTSRSDKILRFWIGATISFATVSIWLASQLYLTHDKSSFATGYNNELRAAKQFIEIKEQWFEGAPRFAEDGTEYVPEHGHEELKYTGEPSEEIDYNWELLHWGRFFLLTENEAREAWGPGYKDFWAPQEGGYLAALDVMHQLHCLDHLRKAYYPEVYPIDSPVHGIMHREHCLDHLRQIIMCNSDLTPIPSRYYTSLHDNYIDSDRPHTCRNFAKVRDWVSDRYNGTSAIPRAPGTGVGSSEWGNNR